MLNFKASHGMSMNFRKHLHDIDNMAASDAYVFQLNKQLNFRSKAHPSVGYIESERTDTGDF